MSNKEAELISRTTYRRMSRQKRARTVQAVKIALLRIITVITIVVFVVAMEGILFNRLVLKWILIISFAVLFVDLMKSIEKEIKKSPRNGHSRRGQA